MRLQPPSTKSDSKAAMVMCFIMFRSSDGIVCVGLPAVHPGICKSYATLIQRDPEHPGCNRSVVLPVACVVEGQQRCTETMPRRATPNPCIGAAIHVPAPRGCGLDEQREV